MTSHLVLITVLAPALAALIGLPAGRRSRPLAVGCAVTGATVALVTALWSVAATWSGHAGRRVSLLGPLDLGAATESLSLRVLPVGALVAVAVTVVSLAVQVYSAGYLVEHPGEAQPAPVRYGPYAATISLFTAAMLLVTHTDDLLLLLVGWELMGLCSYLLIGHHSERPSAKRAALQAFLVTRVGDVGFLLAVVALYSVTHTTNISGIVAGVEAIGPRQATTIGLGLLMGVIGKSAQFPLHGWLPDAMEGPTPVSALIHAATMVAAGVVVLVRFGPLLQRSPTALTVLAVVSSVTMVGAALAAFGADDLKRVLAWSTVSQVAVMLGAVSLGTAAGRAGAIAHLLSHAAFKALLFLVAGVIALRCGTTALAGISDLRRSAPRLTVTLAIGLASLAALPPMTGYVSKETIFTAAELAVVHGHSWSAQLVFVSLAVTTVLTAAYATRLYATLTRYDLADIPRSSRIRTVPPAGPVTPVRVPPAHTVPLAVPAPGPSDGPSAGPSAGDGERDEPSTLGFVDRRGQFQDWDLIADLDTSRAPRFSAERREERAYAHEVAQRRELAGRAERPTGRLARAMRDRYSPQAEAKVAAVIAGQAPSAAGGPAPVAAPAPPGRAQPPVEALTGPPVPLSMSATVAALAAVTVVVAVLPLIRPAGLGEVSFGWTTALAGLGLALSGLGLGLLRGPQGHRDVATRLPGGLRTFVAGGFGYQWAQRTLVVRPALALARLIAAGDDAVIDTYVQAPALLPALGRLAGRVQTGVVTGYLSWLAGAAVAVGVLVAVVGGAAG